MWSKIFFHCTVVSTFEWFLTNGIGFLCRLWSGNYPTLALVGVREGVKLGQKWGQSHENLSVHLKLGLWVVSEISGNGLFCVYSCGVVEYRKYLPSFWIIEYQTRQI